MSMQIETTDIVEANERLIEQSNEILPNLPENREINDPPCFSVFLISFFPFKNFYNTKIQLKLTIKTIT